MDEKAPVSDKYFLLSIFFSFPCCFAKHKRRNRNHDVIVFMILLLYPVFF